MTTKVTIIAAVGAVWCAATAVKCLIALIHRESYSVGWWDASVAGTGRTLDRVRTAIKLLMMVGLSVVSALALSQVLEPTMALYVVLGLLGVTAVVELSAPKRKKR
jgi:hypothetical protein